MTEKEKKTILDMRVAGKQYKEMSSELGIEISALKAFVHRQKHNDVRRCEQCKKVLPKDARKAQRFCSIKMHGGKSIPTRAGITSGLFTLV